MVPVRPLSRRRSSNTNGWRGLFTSTLTMWLRSVLVIGIPLRRLCQAAQYCEEQREQYLLDGQSLIFETVLSSEGKVDFIRRAREAGYFIRLFFVSTNHPSINSSRIAKRVMKGGHDVPIPKIISRYQKSIVNCKRCVALADRVYVYDNSVDDTEARLLFRMTDGQLFKQYTDDIPEWARLLMGEE